MMNVRRLSPRITGKAWEVISTTQLIMCRERVKGIVVASINQSIIKPGRIKIQHARVPKEPQFV